jgi:hypothetical protein
LAIPDRCSGLLVSGTDRLRREQAMKIAGRKNPNRWARVSSNRAHGVVGQNRILLILVGCEARKIPAMGDVFFLTFPFMDASSTGSYRSHILNFLFALSWQ